MPAAFDALQRLGVPLAAGASVRAKAEEVAAAVTAVAAQCSMRRGVMVLWEKLQAFAQQLCRMYLLEAWAMSLELCSDTFARLGHVRVHARVFMFRNQRFRTERVSEVELLNSAPHKSQSHGVFCRAR